SAYSLFYTTLSQHSYLYSFPTRRSSDLPEGSDMMLDYVRQRAGRAYRIAEGPVAGPVHLNFPFREPLVPDFSLDNIWGKRKERRSEEHTSELQSRFDLVCRLLLEKKKLL